MYETICFDVIDNVAEVTLNRPNCLNAINHIMLDEINDAFDRIEGEESIRCVILFGSGRSFSSGFDLKEDVDSQSEISGVQAWRKPLERDFHTLMRPWHCRCPTIAAVQGHCIGGGCEIALACDLTIAAKDAVFGEPEIKFGSGIVAMILPWIVGLKKSKEILLLGRDKISSAEAHQCGMVNEVVNDDRLKARAREIGKQIATLDNFAMALMKRAINGTYHTMGLRSALEQALELDIQIEGTDLPDAVHFADLVREDSLQSAVAWRDRRLKQSGE